MSDDIETQPEEVQAENPPEYEADSLLWRMQFAYNNPHREYLLIEAMVKIERLQADRDHWRSIAEQAVDNADQAVKLLEKLTGINRD